MDRNTQESELRSVIKGLDQDIRNSWIRCLNEYRLTPHQIRKPEVLTRAELAEQSDPIDDLLGIAAPEIKRLFARLMDSDYLVTVASREGINVIFRCDYQLIGRMESMGVLAGANWSEDSQGTNGIGTAIRLQKAVSVVRTDHFSTGIHNLSCTAVPVFGPGGTLQCVINTTTDRPTERETQKLMRSVLQRSAHRIENSYFSRHFPHARVVRLSPESDFADPANEVRLALDDEGRILDASSTLERLLGIARDHVLGQRFTDLFGLDPDVLPPELPHLAEAFGGVHDLNVLVDRDGRHPNRPHDPIARAGGLPAAFAQSLFAMNPRVALDFQRTLKLVQAGLPVVLRGEPGSGREDFARLLQSESAFRSYQRIRCGLDGPEEIARRLADPKLSGLVYLDEAHLLPEHLAKAVVRIAAGAGPGGAAPHLSVVLSWPAETEAYGAPPFLIAPVVDLPPVRLYPNVAAVVHHVFVDQAGPGGPRRLDDTALDILRQHIWPGNLEQLRIAMRYLHATCEAETVLPEHLPPFLFPQRPGQGTDETERDALVTALAINDWNVSRTADYLGKSRATINRRIRDFGLVRGQAKSGRSG